MKHTHLQIPEKIVIQENQPTYGIFHWAPLQKGYVYSLGNALRRTLLSSIQGLAITHLKLPENVLHEFDTIQGVTEDMTDIILNLKRVRLKKINPQPEEKVTIQIKKKTQFKALDIQEASSSYQVLNPDLVICHVDEKAHFELELTIEEGAGYSLAEYHNPKEQKFGEIPIDALFSPVLNVEIERQDALVGSKADYGKLIIDGTKTPEDALREAAQILKDHFELLTTQQATRTSQDHPHTNNVHQEIENFHNLLQTPIDKLGLSPRVTNSLNAHHIPDLGHIVTKPMSFYMKVRNFGKKSFEELHEKVKSKGLNFGMDIKGYEK